MFFFSCKKESSRLQKVRSLMNVLKEELRSAIEIMARYSSCPHPMVLPGVNGIFLGTVPMVY